MTKRYGGLKELLLFTFYLQPLSNNEHRQLLYNIIDTNIYNVIDVLKKMFPQDRAREQYVIDVRVNYVVQ